MLNIDKQNGVVVASFANTDRFDIRLAPSVKETLSQIISEPDTRLVLDLKDIQFVDSTGFGVLLTVLRLSLEKNSFFKICNVSSDVMELVNLMKLDEKLNICLDLDDAIKQF